MSQKSKFWQWIDHRVRVTIADERMLVGTFIAFDKHLNIVLADTEEFRILKALKPNDSEREIKRSLGLIVLRGDNIISISAEKAPKQLENKTSDQHSSGPGKAISVSRTAITQPSNIINSLGPETQNPTYGNGTDK